MEDSATTAALVGLSLALVKVLEKSFARQNKNGNPIEYRLELLEEQVKGMSDKLQEFQRGFFEFREEARIKWAVQEKKDE